MPRAALPLPVPARRFRGWLSRTGCGAGGEAGPWMEGAFLFFEVALLLLELLALELAARVALPENVRRALLPEVRWSALSAILTPETET